MSGGRGIVRAWAIGAWAIGLLLGPLCMAGCDERSRSRVDGTDRPDDAGLLDRGAVTDAGPVEDAMPDGAAVDRGFAPPPDGAPADAATPADAGPITEDDLYRRASQHSGRAACPTITSIPPDVGLQRWSVATRVGMLGHPLGHQWVEIPIWLSGDTGIPEYAGDRPGLLLEALRTAPGGLFGLWREDGVDGLRAGRLGDRGWIDEGLHHDGVLSDRPDAFDAVDVGDLRVRVAQLAEGLFLRVERAPGVFEGSAIFTDLVADRARVDADESGLVLGHVANGQLTVSAHDFAGVPRWDVRLPTPAPGFDLAISADRVAIAHIAPDPRLADLPFGAGYGRPSLVVLDRADGAEIARTALHPDPIRGADPAVGVTDDGWLTAWTRLRVDGDRNRTEIEASRVVDGRAGTPIRITRAHGFSFCPAVGDASESRSIIAWLDTRFGREDILVAFVDDAPWPGPDRPEPSPAPPPFPKGCADSIAAVDGPVQSLDAVPYGGGFHAVWVDGDGILTAGEVDPNGGSTVRWRLPDGPAIGGVRIAMAPIGRVLFGEVGGRVRAWRTTPPAPFEEEPSAPRPLDVDFEGPLHDVAGGSAGVVALVGDPPQLVGIEPAGRRLALPAAAVDPRVLAVGDDVIVGWLVERAGVIDLEWLRLSADAGWDGAEVEALSLPDLADPLGFDLAPHPDGWTALLDAHSGRAFARTIVEAVPADPGQPMRRIEDDPARSTGPVGHRDAVLWLEERPVERFQVNLVARASNAIERLPIDGPRRAQFFLDVDDESPVVLWRAGVEARIARFGPECRLPAASAP